MRRSKRCGDGSSVRSAITCSPWLSSAVELGDERVEPLGGHRHHDDPGELAGQPRHLAALPARPVGTDGCRDGGHEPGSVVAEDREDEGSHAGRLGDELAAAAALAAAPT